MQTEFLKSTGPTCADTETCEPSHRGDSTSVTHGAECRPAPSRPIQSLTEPPTIGESMSSAEAIHARKTAELELWTERDHRLSAISSSELLSSFARELWSERIRLASARMLPGLGDECNENLSALATLCCPSDSAHAALGLTIKGTECSCSASMPTPTASGFGVSDVPRLIERRKQAKINAGNGNGFGLTFEQWMKLERFHAGLSTKGSTDPTLYELAMGFPVGWTDADALETPCIQESPNGSDAES